MVGAVLHLSSGCTCMPTESRRSAYIVIEPRDLWRGSMARRPTTAGGLLSAVINEAPIARSFVSLKSVQLRVACRGK